MIGHSLKGLMARIGVRRDSELITGLQHAPVAPNFADAVTVTANVVDEGLVTLVQLEVSVDGGAATIGLMTPQGGDLYLGSIDPQPAGSLVEYRVTALDDDGDGSASDWNQYTVAAGTVDVVINEIHYNPIESGTDVTEFVELYNNGDVAAGLAGWTFAGFTFTFPAGATLAAGEYLVVAVDAAAFFATYGFLPDYEWEEGALSNSGESLVLGDAAGNERDRVDFDDGGDWPSAPDGNGPSLELVDPALDNNLAASWQASCVDGGTPRAANDDCGAVEAVERPLAFGLGAAWPNPFNPATTIAFRLAETGAANLRVFDILGREVAVLVDGRLAAGEHLAVFDAAGLASGVYVARLQAGARVDATRLLPVK